MKKASFICLLLVFARLSLQAQTFSGYIKDQETRRGISGVSVVAMDSLRSPITFYLTDGDGSFSLQLDSKKRADTLIVSCLGYATQKLAFTGLIGGQTIFLDHDSYLLKEVEIKANRLQQNGDTIVYSVAGFRHKQDRSIADVIAKMPGMEVNDNGTIQYQGKPITKFYIEGLDLMGSKYAMASENISARKVKSVEILRKHQPIKALRNAIFSDNAALNIVLEDNVRDAWSAMLEIGGGMQFQDSHDALYDERAIAMLFGRNVQNMSMYKFNNNGRDIQHELRDLANGDELRDDEYGWIADISLRAPSLKHDRYSFNDTHILTTNWLFRTSKDATLRMQGNYLFDKTTGYKKNVITYTNILGQPIAEEETDATKYRREANGEGEYQLNSDSLYIKNKTKIHADWNESTALTTLNGQNIRQRVEPRRVSFIDNFSLVQRYKDDKSLNVNAALRYQFLPQLLNILNSDVPQRLNISQFEAKAGTGFRHKIGGIYVSYDADVSYKKEHVENKITLKDNVDYQEASIRLTPRVSVERNGFRVIAAVPVYEAHYKLADKSANKLFANPYGSLGYKISGTMDAAIGYSHRTSCNNVQYSVPMEYFSDYTTRIKGNGRLDFLTLDNVYVRFEYANPVSGFFFNISGNYTNTCGVPMYSFDYVNNIYTMMTTTEKSDNDQKDVSAEISKAFGFGKISLSLGGNIRQNKYGVWITDQSNRCELIYRAAYFKFSFMPSAIFSLEEKSTLHGSATSNKEHNELSSGARNYFEHSLTTFFMPGKWLFSLTHELYHGNNNSFKTSYFSDFKVTYSQRRYEISLVVSNIFGMNNYEIISVSSNSMLYTYNHLRPREIFCKLAFSL